MAILGGHHGLTAQTMAYLQADTPDVKKQLSLINIVVCFFDPLQDATTIYKLISLHTALFEVAPVSTLDTMENMFNGIQVTITSVTASNDLFCC